MNFIDKLAVKSAILCASGIKDYTKIEAMIQKRKDKIIKLTEKDVISLFQYGFQAIYGELFKTTIVLLLAWLLHIFIPTLIVMLSFSLIRAFAGGKHLHSSTKCLIFTSVLIIGTGYFVNLFTHGFILFDKIYTYIVSGIILELISTTIGFENILEKFDNKSVDKIKLG